MVKMKGLEQPRWWRVWTREEKRETWARWYGPKKGYQLQDGHELEVTEVTEATVTDSLSEGNGSEPQGSRGDNWGGKWEKRSWWRNTSSNWASSWSTHEWQASAADTSSHEAWESSSPAPADPETQAPVGTRALFGARPQATPAAEASPEAAPCDRESMFGASPQAAAASNTPATEAAAAEDTPAAEAECYEPHDGPEGQTAEDDATYCESETPKTSQ